VLIGGRKDMEAWIRSNGVANTKATYKPYSRQYLEYCNTWDLSEESPVSVSLFLRFGLEEKGWGRSTLTSVAPAAIADLFRFRGVEPTKDPLVLATKKVIVGMTKPSKGKRPLSRKQLERMVGAAEPKAIDIRDILMFILMFGGFLRQSEVVGLRKTQVWVEFDEELEREVLYMYIDMSKTDQEKTGRRSY